MNPVPTARASSGAAVFLTVGTDHHRFDRAVRWVDAWAKDHPEVDVLIQYGTSSPPVHARGVDYFSKGDQEAAMRAAAVVVCHGGPATIADIRRSEKIPLVVPRQSRFLEHVDDHQVRFSKHADEQNLGVVIDTEGDLRAAIDAGVLDQDSLRLTDYLDASAASATRFGELVDRSVPPRTPTRVLYVAGAGRSGSTLLDILMGQVEDCVSVGEIVFVWERGLLLDERCGCGARFSKCEFWISVGDHAFGGWSNVDVHRALELRQIVDRNRHLLKLSVPSIAPDFAAALHDWCDNYLGPLYSGIARAAGTNVVVDSSKHASYAFLLRHVSAIDLRVVQLVRDPRAVAYSWSKVTVRPETDDGSLMPQYGSSSAAAWWLFANSALRVLPALGVPTEIVRYEDLVADPMGEVRKISAFVDLPGDDLGPTFLDGDQVELIQSHTVSGNPMRFDTQKIRIRRDDSWQAAMSANDRRTVTMLASLVPSRKLRYPMRINENETIAFVQGREPQSWPSVSALISTRDRPELLDRAIDAIVAQDYPGELEVIVVFDQSDIDPELAGTRQGRTIRTTRNTRVPGLPGGRNSGVAFSSSDVIALCDDDDEWLPGKLRAQIAVLEATPGAAVATTGIVVQYGDTATERRPDRHAVTFPDLLRSRGELGAPVDDRCAA